METQCPRAMNHMSADMKLVHIRLEEWGRWAKDVGIRAWPAKSLIWRMWKEGTQGASSSGPPPISMPESIAHVDSAVARLGEVDSRVLRKYYLEWAPPEAMAKALSMRVRMFHSVLNRARWRVSGYLIAMES